ncbi:MULTISPECIES: hypothetical protein [Bradyrhizobium]|jgi:hypothetical protein|uniref:portal protein n=3 Tax=Pseudomonadota TaxID=1224 RepID=UPI0028E80EAA|nr:hypothetical protein [Bradyrhizobium viridifuturi]
MAVKIVATDASRAIVGVGCLRMRLCERVGNQAALACVLTGATACQNSDLRRHIPIPRFSIMAKMSTSDLKAMLASEKADALAALSAARLAEERADAMDYYLGDMRKDMPAQDGRSRAVSTDVADTIEGLMPSLMDIFAGSDEVVRFEPVGPEDEAAAQQETDYVNHVFMQQNPGFMTLYSFVKDALLSKVGVVKVWWEEREEESRETYYDLTDDQFALLAQAVTESNGAMKIIEHTAHDLAGETQTEATS